MAPEIGKGEYGKEIDIYSLGIILYELLTGNVPFNGESSQEIILKHLTADPDLSQVPQPFAHVIQKSLAKNPASRFRDCREMLHALGWELDASGLAVKKSGDPEVPPLIQPVRGQAGRANELPVARPIGSFEATIAGSPPPAASNANPWRYRYGGANANQTEKLYQEPLAQWVHQAFVDGQNYIRQLPPGGRGIAIAVLIISLILNAGWIAPMLMVLFVCYLFYYVVWYISGGPSSPITPKMPPRPFVSKPQQPQSPQQARAAQQARTPQGFEPTVHYQNVAAVQPAAPKPAPIPYRVALRNWQVEQRSQLSKRGFWTRSHGYTRSWAFAGIVMAVIAASGSMLTIARDLDNANAIVSGIAWTSIMSLLMTWTVLFLSRRWETRSEDSIVFRFVQLTAGVVLGLISFSISDFLMVPWESISSEQGISIMTDDQMWNRSWKGFYGENSVPLLAGHIAYFGALMWIVRWWRQSDVLRKNRFSLWAIAWSVGMAGLVQGLFYFPTPWCFILAGVTSFTLQMASPWIDHKESTQLA
jgi:hypothetical protein